MIPEGLKQSVAQWQDFMDREFDVYAMKKYEILLDWMGNLAQKEVLIIGSGSGELAGLIALRGGIVTAIDIDQPSVYFTAQTALKLGVQIHTKCTDLESLSEEKKFDIVVATDVIEHIENDQKAIEKIQSLTKNDGIFVITVPALQLLFGYHDEVLGHFRRYSKGQLVKKIGGPFIQIRKVRYFGLMLIPVVAMISCLLRRPYPIKVVGIKFKKGEKNFSIVGWLMRLIFSLEKKINPPVGTSLLLLAKKLSGYPLL